MKQHYIIISPCRNEEEFIRETLNSVLAQTRPPDKWVIVDDGSTDRTPEILQEYSDQYPWISVVTRQNRGARKVGPGVVDAFYEGYSSIDPANFEYFCKLDLDLRLPPRYFEILLERMEKNPRLGTCSGKSYQEHNGKLYSERMGDETSLGMTKLFRISCFEDIGGFVRDINWDGIDCHMCRMKGWIACSWDEPELRFIHLRPMGSSQVNIFHGRMRQGYGQYFTGTSPIYMLAVAANRAVEKPYIIGSLVMLYSYFKSVLLKQPKAGDTEFRKFVRRFQNAALLRGKSNAVQKIYKEKGIPWHQKLRDLSL